MALDRLIEKIEQTQNPTVAGLDPKLDYVPEYIKKKCFEKHGETLKGAAKALYEFNKGLIDALYDIVPAVKPQAAYYEMYGVAGVKALYKTQEYARSKGMYVITDGKRNDIGTTMEAYATAHLGKVKVGGEEYEPFLGDALTVNGYLGTDGIKPLLKVCKENDKGIFVLVKTSNPSSGELQDRPVRAYGQYVRGMGQGAARSIRLQRRRRGNGRYISRTDKASARDTSAYVLPYSRLWRSGRDSQGHRRSVRQERSGRDSQQLARNHVRVSERKVQ